MKRWCNIILLFLLLFNCSQVDDFFEKLTRCNLDSDCPPNYFCDNGSCKNISDTTPPETTITSYPPNPSNSPDATFEFTCNETGCTFECQIDRIGWEACTSPKEYRGLSEGNHFFEVRATDLAGNKELAPDNYGWTISLGVGWWSSISNLNAPSERANEESCIWSGAEMIIWGGKYWNGSSWIYLNTGGRYNPITDTWQSISTTNAPSARAGHTAIWTGNYLIVWGGWTGGSPTNTGGKYNPSTDTWQSISTTNAPSARYWNSNGIHAVWSGSEMLIWGGWNASIFLDDGGKYNPTTDTWIAIPSPGFLSGRDSHTSIWTGSEMIVWGGPDQVGGRYNPLSNNWVSTPLTNAPSGRHSPTGIWTGSEIIIWGGSGPSPTNTGSRYNPSTDTWQSISTTNAPSGRKGHTAVWTGNKMIIWGGNDGTNPLNTGGIYDPSTDSWQSINLAGEVPSPRESFCAVWTGSDMIIWGGVYDDGVSKYTLNTGGRYTP